MLPLQGLATLAAAATLAARGQTRPRAIAGIVYARGELRLQDPRAVGEVVTSPLPHTYLRAEDLPPAYNPNDVNGLTLTSTDLNQHIPVYCGSCWAHAPMSSLADRLKIASRGKGRDVIPAIQARRAAARTRSRLGLCGKTHSYKPLAVSGLSLRQARCVKYRWQPAAMQENCGGCKQT